MEMVGCGYICPGFPAAHGSSESTSHEDDLDNETSTLKDSYKHEYYF